LLSDMALGGSMLLVAAFVFPFFDVSSPIHDYFPAREWAVRLPAFILIVGLSGIGFFENKKKALKAKLRAA
ncbi:hypothetical protein EDD17DRAFT_1542313, partial [Pisolithus thermaeus]